ncbi:MAG: fused MFS/spermidine synthase [Candidatus Omnitrophota bacterium]
MDKKQNTIIFAVLLLGISSITAQIVLLREFLIIFYGNEISMGYLLAAWLLGIALGSWLLGRFADKIQNKYTVFSLCQLGLGFLLPSSILAIRAVKAVFNLVPGQIIDFGFMVVSSFAIILPLGMLLGFMFAFSCRMYESPAGPGVEQISKVYILEDMGSMLGGFVVSFFLIRSMQAFDLMAVLGILNISIALRIGTFANKQLRKTAFLLGMVICILILSLKLFGQWDKLNARSLCWQWQGSNLLSSTNSIYGNIALTSRQEQISFFYNGLHLYTIPDKQTAEESAHFALLAHKNPQTILLIGGGINGSVQEILQHSVEKIDYLELDPELIKQAKVYVPKSAYLALENPKVKIHYLDARFFVKNSKNKYDCVILNMGNPYTAQINRFYTVEFFQEIKQLLKPNGIFSLTLISSENYISNDLREFLASIYKSLNQVFAQVKVIPGDTACFLASSQRNAITDNYQDFRLRTQARNLNINYVRDYYLFNKLAPDKIQQFLRVLQPTINTKTNHDFQPISYYYDMVFWASLFRDSWFRAMLKAMDQPRLWFIAAFGLMLLLGITLRRKKEKYFYKQAVLVTVLITGFAEMSFQIVLLLCFQVIYGYVFYKLGLILTCFMLGLVLGAMYITKTMPKIKDDFKIFILTQISVCLYPLLLPLIFYGIAQTTSSSLAWLGANIIFPGLPIIAGFIGGIQFPLANKIYLAGNQNIGKAAGINFGADLCGACIGAFLTGTFLIPILGIAKTCLFAAMLNIGVLIMLIITADNIQINTQD